MSANRIFLPQDALDALLGDGRVTLDDDLLTLSGGMQLRLTSALRFMEEVAEGTDPNDLVGKVKTLADVTALSGEHCADSVIVGDNAYQVIEGFVCDPVEATIPASPGGPDPLTNWFMEQ